MKPQRFINLLLIVTVGLLTYKVFATDPPFTVWDGTYEDDPTSSDQVSKGDDHLRDVKKMTRGRASVEHDFSTHADLDALGASVDSAEKDDDGRHRIGSARTFFHATEPTVLAQKDWSASGNAYSSASLDDGRLWVDLNDGGRLYAYDDNGTGHDFTHTAAADDFYPLLALPTGAIILWDADSGDGDEDCDGSTTAGDCPCGTTRADEFDGVLARGADAVSSSSNIPEEVGSDCYGTADAACDDADSNYDDTLDVAEMPAHDHSDSVIQPLMDDPNSGSAPAGTNGSSTLTGGIHGGHLADGGVVDEGGGEPHYHPFRTVLFCRVN